MKLKTNNHGIANKMVKEEGWKIIKEDKMILSHNVIHYIITLEKDGN